MTMKNLLLLLDTDPLPSACDEVVARDADAVLKISGAERLCERFVLFRDRLSRRLPTIARVSAEQVDLSRLRRGEERPDTENLMPLLLSTTARRRDWGGRGERPDGGNQR